ncbi:MAG: hypothetical protein ABIP35_12035 [Ginsengibacter sp.]
MSTPLSHVKRSILEDLWNSDSDKFDELVTEIKASIAENGYVTIEDDYYSEEQTFTTNIKFVDWLKEKFYKQ